MKPEESYRSRIDRHLLNYFELQEEVWSEEKKRIDYVLKCKKSGALFGLEVKRAEISRGRDLALYLKQAQHYSKMRWKHKFKGSNRLIVFIAPSVSQQFLQIDREYKAIRKGTNRWFYPAKHDIFHKHHNINSLIGELCNVGEVKNQVGYPRGVKQFYFSFIFRNKEIWSSLYGLNKKNYEHYQNKLQNDLL